MSELRPLISQERIATRVSVLARQITRHYQGTPFVVLGLLNGSIFFLVDLVRQLPPETLVETWRVQSYQGKASTGKIRGLPKKDPLLRGKSVLIVEDILDTGLTLHTVQAHVRKLGAKNVETCVLLNKKRSRRFPDSVRWTGFQIPDRFVVGYGLDWDGRYRALREICTVSS